MLVLRGEWLKAIGFSIGATVLPPQAANELWIRQQ
jgi:hypothetical protein